MAKYKTTAELKEGELNVLPEMYRSPAGNPSQDRMRNRMYGKSTMPRSAEVLEGSIILDSSGDATETIKFKENYPEFRPLVVGIAQLGDGRIVRIPYGDVNGGGVAILGKVGAVALGTITKYAVEIKFRSTSADAAKIAKYKLRVYDLSLIAHKDV